MGNPWAVHGDLMGIIIPTLSSVPQAAYGRPADSPWAPHKQLIEMPRAVH